MKETVKETEAGGVSCSSGDVFGQKDKRERNDEDHTKEIRRKYEGELLEQECKNERKNIRDCAYAQSSVTPTTAEVSEREMITSGQGESPAKGASPDLCPHREIIAAYHEILPELPKVRVWNDPHRTQLRARWREAKERQSTEWWREFFEFVRQSPFLMGEKKDWRADLMWLVRKSNIVKVLNGRYHQENGNGNGGLKYSEKTRRSIKTLQAWLEEGSDEEQANVCGVSRAVR